MKLYKKLISGALCLALTSATVGCQADAGEKPGKKEVKLDEVKKSISAGLEVAKPGIVVTDVEESAIDGLYKATIDGGSHVYITGSGKHFIAGDIFEVTPGKIVNLTESSRNGDRAKAMASVDAKDMITFSPKGDVKRVMYVFTDVDCGYCQLLHSKVPEYNEMGIEVRYLAYPRAGIDSQSYKKIKSAWCADDKHDALTKLKQRESIPENLCKESPVAAQFELGRKIGLSGTPALILEDGELISGYLEPARLAEMLEL